MEESGFKLIDQMSCEARTLTTGGKVAFQNYQVGCKAEAVDDDGEWCRCTVILNDSLRFAVKRVNL